MYAHVFRTTRHWGSRNNHRESGRLPRGPDRLGGREIWNSEKWQPKK
jgi:hypothetical protein